MSELQDDFVFVEKDGEYIEIEKDEEYLMDSILKYIHIISNKIESLDKQIDNLTEEIALSRRN